MRTKLVSRVWLLFLIFCLTSSMTLMDQDGNIVVAATVEATGFETGTLNQNFNSTYGAPDWIETIEYEPHGGEFEVDNVDVKTGTKAFLIDRNDGWWNFTYDDNELMIVNISWVYSISHGSADGATLYFNNADDYTILRIQLYQDDTPAHNNDFAYWDHNHIPQVTDGPKADHLDINFSFDFNKDDDVTYWFDGVEISGSPYNICSNYSITSIYFDNYGGDVAQFVIDDINVTWEYGLEEAVGDITINVFNESNISEALDQWRVYVKNTLGGIIYSSTNNFNPLVITLNDIGFGIRIFEIYNDSYYERYYTITTVRGANHTLNAYLPPVSEAYLYYIKVQSSVEQPLYQVLIEISRNFNGTINDVGSGYTDIFGMYPIYLVGNQQYAINLSLAGYDDFYGTFITDPNCYGYDCPIVFTLGDADYNETIFTLGDVIHFNATINSAGTIQVWYEDYLSNTTNTNITIYEYYNGTYTYNFSEERTGDNSFTFTDGGYNTSMMHYIILHVNHTDFDPNHQILYLLLHPLTSGLPSEATLEDRWIDVFGNWELGWTKTLLVVVPCLFFLVVFGPAHAGLGVLSSGLYMGFTTLMIDWGTVVTGMFIGISSILAVVGLILIITKRGRNVV